MNIRINEKSMVARLAAHILHEECMAVVIGKTNLSMEYKQAEFFKK
jgi:hypothetical protein